MATSGSSSVKFTDYNTLKWSWEVYSLNPTNKEATISWKAEIISGSNGLISSSVSKSWSMTVMDYDKQKSTNYSGSANISIGNNTTKQIASGRFTVGHTASAYGRTSVEFYLYPEITFAGTNISKVKVTCSFTLDAPPSGATILSFPSFTDEENPTVEYSLDYTSVDSLTAVLDINGISVTKTLPTVASGIATITLSDTERNNFRNAVTTSNTATAQITLTSKYGSTSQSRSLNTTYSIVNANPTLSPSYSNNSSYTYILADSNSLTVRCTATAKKGASIVLRKVTCGSKVLSNGDSSLNSSGVGTLTDITSNIITFTAIDSRGNSTSQDLSVSLVPYIKPTCNIATENTTLNDSGTTTFKFAVNGMFYNGSLNDGGSSNAITLYYRTKINGSWSSSIWLDKSISGNTYSTSITVTTSSTTPIQVEVTASDSINSVTTTLQGTKPLPIFDWGEDSFNVNVPLTYKGVGFPMIEEEGSYVPFTNSTSTFYYRKWTDGIAEIWGRSALPSTSVGTEWGSLYTTGALTNSNIPYPFTFTDKPIVTAQLEPNYQGGFLGVAGGSGQIASTTQTGMYEILRGAYLSSGSFRINYYIRGRWK